MASVGAYLRELRTRRGVSLEEIARTTRVAQRYLESLETDTYDGLPAPVFIRGFIRAYCQALGEPPHEALACYDAREGSEQRPVRPPPLSRAGAPEPHRRGAILVSFVLLVVLGMALFTVALVIQPRERGARSPAEMRPAPPPASPSSELATSTPRAAPPPPTVPGPAAVTAPSAAPRGGGSASPAVSAPPRAAARPAPPALAAPAVVPGLETLAGSVSSPYRLTARVSDATWIRVRTEGGATSEETVSAGEVREWVSERPFVVTIGNAGGVVLELNGRALPPLGAKGMVVPRLVLPPQPR
jgi:cytoskeleton protein RodZ